MAPPALGELATPTEYRQCAVIGAGTMGTGIGYVLGAAGAAVTIVEPDPDQVERSQRVIAERVRREQARMAAPADPDPELRHWADQIRYLADVRDLPTDLDLVVESVPERVALKREVLRAAESRRPRLLGTNTSGIAIAELAAALRRPERLVGLHFFNPVWSTSLIEIVRPDSGPDSDPDPDPDSHPGSQNADPGSDSDRLVAAARRLAELLGKEAIVVADRPGFATTRLGVLLGLEAIRMLEDGVAGVEDLDRAMELGYRHPMGPLRLTDLIGLDVRLDIATNLQRSYGDRFAPPALLRAKVARGELGRKSGQGFYSWP